MSGPLHVLTKTLGETRALKALEALRRAGYVCVPRKPTKEMIDAAWAAAMAEKADEVWAEMIEQWDSSIF